MPEIKSCIKKDMTCGHRDLKGRCHIFGCIIKKVNHLTPIEKFVFGLNPYERKLLKQMIGG
jgi:hypothetical protein